MEVSANFGFLKQEFPHAAESASYAEHHVYGDPRASCFHARHALERLVKRVYKVEKTLSPPRGHEPGRVPQRAGLPRDRARGRVAEGGVHPTGRQCGGAWQQDADAGAGVERRAGAGARPLLGGPHLSAERGGEPSRHDLRRVPCPLTGIGRRASQRRGTGHAQEPTGCRRRRAQGSRRRAEGVARTARRHQGGERDRPRDP